MKRFLPGTGALAALCLSIPAFAADLPARVTKAPPALVSPAYNWSGFYLGVSAGYTFAEDEDITTTGQAAGNINNVAIGARPGRVRLDRDGFIGGGQMGYNWQVSPNWVFGLEADISYVDIRRDVAVIGTTGLNNIFRTRMDYLGTVRGRIGYAWDRTLLYATGGLAMRRSRTASTSLARSVNSSSPATIAVPRPAMPWVAGSSMHSRRTGP
jgi:outer membrane immunogenic protein